MSSTKIMVFGSGASTQGVLHALRERGAEVSSYISKETAIYSPGLEGEAFPVSKHPNPCQLLIDKRIDLVIPMSIDWNTADWVDEFLALEIPILSPTGEGMQLERSRDFARDLCQKYGVAFPKAFVAQNRLEAEDILRRYPGAYVIKNPLCSPLSPVHTVLCETTEDTKTWLRRVNYQEGIFLQEYMGQLEAGHIAFISGGTVTSLITNQEYKRAFNGNMGVIAGAPLGGLVEKDPDDKYGLARQLLHPLIPWFKEVGFHGPVQVTAIYRDDKWYVLEYNVRIGVTCGPIIMQMLRDPIAVLDEVVHDKELHVDFIDDLNFGCSITLAGYGYPFGEVDGPNAPVRINDDLDCDVWWNEVAADKDGHLYTTGQRIVDLVAIEPTLDAAIDKVYKNIKKIRCTNSYYRTDIGKTLWPPGRPVDN